ncbi:MAG: hypothetical protein SPF80_01130 [Candidatus Cryptobacteroides sp.]|nr:hypothetical protein [Bacteroidales bacterium]MDD7154563.1 hypothetical protein [Bacteroidales bacterium]MDY5443106.1 hypothetical protein [Candidatus Cryptobacteroides sp.]MDY5494596.1 hypothetical protein [Candidatus Cryptobacteroides sp.]MDY5570611.1 hypothetical protein [Candidatus Cryptobacteroides sp.]
MTSRINNRPTALCIAVIVLLAMTSCETVTSFVRELRYGQVVAKVGSHRLYASELASYIPDSASPEDSTRLALQYINTWASDQLFTDVAERELSKSEKNVDSELEDYRHSLLKYRYEQKYVNQRLDTAVTKAQIEKYYDDHAENFKLSLPIAKAVYMNISADSPNLEIIKKKMRSDKPEARIEADSIAFSSAFRYTDFGDRWVDLVKLSREVGTDYGTLLSQVRDGYAELPDGNGNLNIVYFFSLMRAGQTGPVEYFEEQIRDIILSTRKQALLSRLERDLIENARNQENFVIY